jgi:hypothetical protein
VNGQNPQNPNNPPEKPWEQRLQEACTQIEQDLRRVVNYIDTEVVPDVRKHGSSALRAAAEQLQKLAQHMDDNQPPKAGGPAGS